MSADVSHCARELQSHSALVDTILARPEVFPARLAEPERLIRCCRGNAERAVCRALARAAVQGEWWRLEVVSPR